MFEINQSNKLTRYVTYITQTYINATISIGGGESAS